MVPMVAPPDPGEDTPPDRDEDTPRVHRPLSQLRDCWCFTPSLLFFFRWKWGLVKVFMAASRPTLDIFLLRDTGLASLTTSCPGLTSISAVTLSPLLSPWILRMEQSHFFTGRWVSVWWHGGWHWDQDSQNTGLHSVVITVCFAPELETLLVCVLLYILCWASLGICM